MPSPQASPIHLSSLQCELLQRLVKRTTREQRLVKRGRIILEAAEGVSNTKIAHHQQVDYETVRHLLSTSQLGAPGSDRALVRRAGNPLVDVV